MQGSGWWNARGNEGLGDKGSLFWEGGQCPLRPGCGAQGRYACKYVTQQGVPEEATSSTPPYLAQTPRLPRGQRPVPCPEHTSRLPPSNQERARPPSGQSRGARMQDAAWEGAASPGVGGGRQSWAPCRRERLWKPPGSTPGPGGTAGAGSAVWAPPCLAPVPGLCVTLSKHPDGSSEKLTKPARALSWEPTPTRKCWAQEDSC